MNYLLGIDVSTTATKALLIDEQGRVASVGVSEYSFETPQPLWSEQHQVESGVAKQKAMPGLRNDDILMDKGRIRG